MKRRAVIRTLAAIGVVALLSACHGGTGSGVIPGGASSAGSVGNYTGPSTLAVHYASSILATNASYIGPATVTGSVTVNLQPDLPNEEALLAYAASTANPHSGNYRHWLTPQEIGAMFGASSSEITSIGKYFANYHISVGTWPQHLMLVASGTQANMEAALGTKLGYWRLQTSAGPVTVLAPQPSVPPHFASAIPVQSVMNLVSFHPEHTYIERPAATQGAGYGAPVIQNGFDYRQLIAAGDDGTGVNIGIIGTGPISSADVPAYAHASGITRYGTVVQKNVTAQPASAQNNGTGTGTFDNYPGDLATPPPVTSPSATCTSTYAGAPTATCNPEDGEAQLDTEQTAGMAPGATIDFYLAFNTENGQCGTIYGCPSGSIGVEGIYLTDDEIQQAIADDTVDVLSMSFGLGEVGGAECASGCYYNSSGVGPGPDEMAALAAEGITVFASSGDNGAYQCDNGGVPETTKCVSYPATDPSVIAVGGVNAPFTDAGQLQPGTEITAWAENTTYGGDGYFDNSPGSGGGASCCFAAPIWQQAADSATKRETPDIALLADPSTGPMILVNAAFSAYEGYGASGGTSAAAPEAAAMFADFLTACKASSACAHAHGAGTYGYRWGIAAAPAFYSIASGESGYGTQAACEGGTSGAFYDVCAGSNGVNSGGTIYSGYPSGPGYDMVTGLGVPFGGPLAEALFTYCSCGTLNLAP
ncbi:MAG: S53 family peptidase [Candidatus Tyrphobacter sp.]